MYAALFAVPLVVLPVLALAILIVGSNRQGNPSAGAFTAAILAFTTWFIVVVWMGVYGLSTLVVEQEYRHKIHMVGNTAIVISSKNETLNVVKMFGVIPEIDKQDVLETKYKQGPYAGLYMDVPKYEYKLVDKEASIE